MADQKAGARLAVDIGGTFTDVVLEHGGVQTTAKVLTTPAAPEEGVLAGVRRALEVEASATALSPRRARCARGRARQSRAGMGAQRGPDP